MASRLGRDSLPRERQATFLSDDSSDKTLVQLHDRLPPGGQVAWRCSRLRSVVHEYTISAGQLNTSTHTYMYLPYGHVTNGDLSATPVGEDG